MVKCCLALLIFTTALTPGRITNAAQPTDFRFFASLRGELTPQVPTRVPLPGTVIAETSNNFSDLRIFDDTGLEIPYVIYEQSGLPQTTFTFTVLSYSQTADGEEIVLERPKKIAAFREIVFFTAARDFKKSVQVQTSDDLSVWHDVTTDTLFDFSSRIDLRKTTVKLPETDAVYVKILLRDNTPSLVHGPDLRVYADGLEILLGGKKLKAFRIDRIAGRAGATPPAFRVYDQAHFTNLHVTTDTDRNTIIHLGRVNLPIAKVILTVDNAYYYRQVALWAADTDTAEAYRQVASGIVYKIPGMNTPENTLRYDQPQRQFLQLKILNGANPPLRLQQVDIAWIRRNLYFVPEAGREYAVYFGNRGSTAPEYELKHLLAADHRTLKQYPTLSVGEVQNNSDYDPPIDQRTRERVEKTVLIGVVLLLTCGMGIWVYQLMRKIPARSNDG